MVIAAILTLSILASSHINEIYADIEDHLPGNTTGPVGNIYASYKFDNGFYVNIQEMMDVVPTDGDSNVYDGKVYHDVIFIVPRDDGDNRDPSVVASENKAALAKRLADVGAFEIKPAKLLSFVTASVPVRELPGLSLHDEILKIGDGALIVEPDVDTAHQTTGATIDNLRTTGNVLNGSGVVVGLIDSIVNHPTALNEKVLKRSMCTVSGCDPVQTLPTRGETTHGTRVAHILAASGLPLHNGTATGVTLLSATRTSGVSVAHAFDWMLINGADVVNWSQHIRDNDLNILSCAINPSSYDMIVNEAVDKGMIIVKTAGNTGHGYGTIGLSACSPNVLTVGGVNDRANGIITMYNDSSRGPAPGDPRMKPDLVAPAYMIETLSFIQNSVTNPRSGTSYAAPQVSATAAILLQAHPDMTVIEVKAALLLGSSWKGPIPCNSPQFENTNGNDPCSHAMQPVTSDRANSATAVGILNNVGFGILNVPQTLEYTSERTPTHNHVMGDYLDEDTNSRQYSFQVTDTSKPVKVILTWLAHPHGSIVDQATRSDTVQMANLDFMIRTPTGQTINADSEYQTNEFAVFNPPSTGTYTITVTGSNLDKINKPVQNYALASTHSLTILPAPFLNRAPVAYSDIVIINPTWKDPAIVRLTGSDQNGDSISFSVSRNPMHGTVSTDEQITKTSSRMFYNASSTFGERDTFEITPQDGLVAGKSTTITILAESLPTGANGDAMLDSAMVKKWDTLEVKHGHVHKKYSATFSGPTYPVSAIYLGSVNMEGVDAQITTSSGLTYTAAVPPSGDRMIALSSPLSIRSVVLSADGLDEESAHDIAVKKPIPRKSAIHSTFLYDDVRMFAGYVPAACTGSTVSGAQGSSLSCPAHVTFGASSMPDLAIPDNSDAQDTFDTMLVPVNGTIKSVSVSVDVSHTYAGDLKVEMSSPSGKTVTLHNREGGGNDDIKKTYTSATFTALKTLLDTDIAGNWTLSIGDYAGGDVGTLNSWSVSMQYEPTPVRDTSKNSTADSVTVFSDDFESGVLSKWTETGEGDWTVSTSQSHSAPTIPGRATTNKVLHSDNCDTSCTVTTKNTIDLSKYNVVTLSFWRFIDYGFDGNEYLRVDISDGSSWKTAFHWSPNLNRGDDNKWHSESYDMSEYAGKSSVAVRFVTQQSSATEDVQIDDIVINATTGSSKPTKNTTGTVTPPATYSVYVADTDDYEILAYSSTGIYQGEIVSRKSGGLGKPFDVVFGPDNHLYVSDNTYKKIRKYHGTTGVPMGKTSTSAEWASTVGVPNGMTWNGNTLYVATLRGVEKISSSGSNLGYFGDASRTPSSTSIPKIVSPYDVTFCPDGLMYVADRSLDKILYYDGSSGKYRGTISDTPQSTQPDMDEAAGLICGPAIAGSTGATSLFQSGEDAGWVNEINYSTKKIVRQFTTLVDEPYGMDFDDLGNLYVANKDDDNILQISAAGTTAVFATGTLDDPRGVTIGPRYASSSSSSISGNGGDSSSSQENNNDGPEIALQNNTEPVQTRMIIPVSSNMTFTITATDPENDSVTLGVIPYAIPPSVVSLTDYKNGTGTILIGTSGIEPDTYAFMITAHDGQNLERFIYTVIVS